MSSLLPANPGTGLWGEGPYSANSEPGGLEADRRQEEGRMNCLLTLFLEPLPPHLGWALRCGGGGEEHGGSPQLGKG